MAKATTVRFSDEVYQRLDQASARTGMPVNSIVVAACLEWMQRHTPEGGIQPAGQLPFPLPAAPRWSTIRRARRRAGRSASGSMYPFERFSGHAKQLLNQSQAEAEKAGFNYRGAEHLLLGAFGNPQFNSARILEALGVKEADARSAIHRVITHKAGGAFGGTIPTPRGKQGVEMAFQVCARLDRTHVGTDHILLALAVEGEGIAAHVLKDLGGTPERIEAELAKLTEPEA